MRLGVGVGVGFDGCGSGVCSRCRVFRVLSRKLGVGVGLTPAEAASRENGDTRGRSDTAATALSFIRGS
jgi:hypothetical protein